MGPDGAVEKPLLDLPVRLQLVFDTGSFGMLAVPGNRGDQMQTQSTGVLEHRETAQQFLLETDEFFDL